MAPPRKRPAFGEVPAWRGALGCGCLPENHGQVQGQGADGDHDLVGSERGHAQGVRDGEGEGQHGGAAWRSESRHRQPAVQVYAGSTGLGPAEGEGQVAVRINAGPGVLLCFAKWHAPSAAGGPEADDAADVVEDVGLPLGGHLAEFLDEPPLETVFVVVVLAGRGRAGELVGSAEVARGEEDVESGGVDALAVGQAEEGADLEHVIVV